MKKVVLVTGSSTGLGLTLCLQLARDGHIVYASMRNLEKKEALTQALKENDAKAHVIALDVNSTDSVFEAVNTIIKEQGRIDCLINNAGMGFIKTTEQASIDEIQQVMDTNFTGVVRTTKAVMPWMREERQGHIINVSSIGGLIGQPFNEIYCASKFALEGYTESLASYLQPAFNINFSLIEPGGIHSDFANTALSNFKQEELVEGYKEVFSSYVNAAQKRAMSSSKTPIYQQCDEVAQCIIDIMQSPKPPLRMRTSDWAKNFCQLKTDSDPTGNESVKRVQDYFLPSLA